VSKVVEVPGMGNVEFPDEMSDEQIASALRGETASAEPEALRQFPKSEPSGLAERAAGWLGETGRGLVTGASRLATAVDPALAAAGAAGSYLVPGTGEGSFGERWRNEMEGLRRGREESAEEAPVANVVGSLLPVVAAAPAFAALPSVSGSVGAAAPLATRMAAGGIDAALYSGASAAGAEADRAPLEAAVEAAGSPMSYAGAAAPAMARAVPAVTGALKAAALRRLPSASVSPSAEALRKLGVEGMTLGQQTAPSPISEIESAAAKRIGGMAPERRAALQNWRDAVLKRALPPGMTEVPRGAMSNRLTSIYEGFEPAYGAIKAEEVFPAIHAKGKGIPLQSTKSTPGAFDQAITDPAVLATTKERALVKRFLDNELSLLPGGTERPGMVQPVPAGSMLKMRSNIRSAAHDARLAKKNEIAKLLENGEEAVTRALESQLSGESAAALKAADKQYAQYKAVEEAANKAGLRGKFTPFQLGQALKKAAGGPRFARGAGGELRQLAEHGEEVFQEIPQTGVTAQILNQLPGVRLMPGAGTRLLNQPSIKAAILGQELPGAAARAPIKGPNIIPWALALRPDTSYGPETNSEESAEPRGPDPVKLLTENARRNPSALGPYAADIAARLKEGGPDAVARWHYLQNSKDPQYREVLKKLGGLK
jgi:hypothetical protein